jgi:hypothetical protein
MSNKILHLFFLAFLALAPMANYANTSIDSTSHNNDTIHNADKNLLIWNIFIFELF